MIKYLGSKRTILPKLLAALNSLDSVNSVLDAFSGTARVGYELKNNGYQVFSNDINTYAHVLAQCHVEAEASATAETASRLIAELNQLTGKAGYITATYCLNSRYFQPHNGEKIDAIREQIEAWDLPPLLKAIRQRIENSQQVLILLNRRGYSPVLYCSGCGWKSQCNQCSAFKVFHKADRTLRCHHCGDTQRVPKKCPVCSNQDITMLGMGTERIEETLLEALSDLSKAKSERIQIMRIDADSTKTKGSLQAQLDRVHSGEVEVLIGTQMIAKGHDFRRMTLVAALEVDGALYSNDFRSTERLFALLMQAAGRSGRDVHFNSSQDCELWVQTFNPKHPVFEFLKNHDYAGFANHQLLERQQANMPPFCSQALIKAESRSQENAQKFLLEIKALADSILHARVKSGQLPSLEHILVFSPIPMNMRKIANLERAQLLIESQSRKYLQSFLHELKLSMQLKSRDFTSVHRWVIDIDPHTL